MTAETIRSDEQRVSHARETVNPRHTTPDRAMGAR